MAEGLRILEKVKTDLGLPVLTDVHENTPVDEVSGLAEAKYGVSYFCPDHGDYAFDKGRDHVVCGVHGNREQSRQNPHLDDDSSFSRFIDSLEEITAALRFEEDAMIATVAIVRSGEPADRQGTE